MRAHVSGSGAGCGGMWQERGHVVWGQAYGIDWDMWQGWGIWLGVEACSRVWGHVAEVVAGCGAMSQG